MKKINFKRVMRRPRPKLKRIPVRAMIPNVVTLLAAASGITSIRYSAQGEWRLAIFAIFIACMLDGLDGRVARMLNASSRLGAELDSLSDFVSFGVAPALFAYFWIMGPLDETAFAWRFKGIFWAFALFYALCCGFRLARFNIMPDDQCHLPYWKYFFVGLPAPGAAGLLVTPAIWQIYTGWDVIQNPLVGSLMMILLGILMASPLPTFSAKAVHIKIGYMPAFLLAVIFTISMLIAQFWLTLGVIGVIYLSTIPVCLTAFRKFKMNYEQSSGSLEG